VQKYLNKIIGFIKSNNTHERTQRVQKNILFTALLKAINIGIGYVLMPLTLHYLSKDTYGLWLTLSSVIAWFNVFDIGLSNGLRNKVAEALANNDTVLIKKLVSTTYAIITLVALGIMVIGLVIVYSFNWISWLNVSTISAHELQQVMAVMCMFFSIQFVLKVVLSVVLAYQLSFVNNLINTLINIATLCIVVALGAVGKAQLLNYAWGISLSAIAVYGFATIYLYAHPLRAALPNWRSVDWSLAPNLFQLSVKFFMIQVAAIVVFSTDNFLINHFFSSAKVVEYNVVFKYYNLITVGFFMISSPLLTAYTEAYNKNDMQWIHSTYSKLLRAFVIGVGITIIMTLCASYVYDFWLRKQLVIHYKLNIYMAVYVLINVWILIHYSLISGVSKIQLGTYSAIAQCIINIPVAYVLCVYFKLDATGVILANIIVLLPDAILSKIQYHKIVNNTATGIWNK
jgi:O-antigen/teichoic acid export membrane protein